MTRASPTHSAQLPAAARQAREEILKGLKGVRNNTTTPQVQSFKGRKPNTDTGRPSPVTTYVHSLGDYLTTQEVADELGVSPQLIRKWAKARITQAPSFVAPFGQLRVHLYTPEDVEALAKHLAASRQIIPTAQAEPMPEPEALAKARSKAKKKKAS